LFPPRLTRGTAWAQIRSDSELERTIASVGDILSQPRTNSWEKRVETLVRLRGIANGEAAGSPVFVPALRAISEHLAASVKDLRSQVSRETCVTVAQVSGHGAWGGQHGPEKTRSTLAQKEGSACGLWGLRWAVSVSHACSPGLDCEPNWRPI
jgi:CLIP-associating protein 1/2